MSRSGREVHLGPTEFRLLEFLMQSPGRVYSREQLLDGVWGRDIYIDERTVDVHVGRLRARAATERMPIIMLTARGEESERVRGLSTGADDYIVKPFSVPAISSWTARKSASRARAARCISGRPSSVCSNS